MSNTSSTTIIDGIGRLIIGEELHVNVDVMHETWVEDRDFKIYDIRKRQLKQPVLQFLLQKIYITKYNYLCTKCNAVAKKLSKLDYKEIEEKEHNKFYHQQASNNDLTMIVGNL